MGFMFVALRYVYLVQNSSTLSFKLFENPP